MKTDRFMETSFVSTSSVASATPSLVSGKVKVRPLPIIRRYIHLTPFPAFSFDATGTKEKAKQKENAVKGVSPLRRRQGLRALDRAAF